MGGGERRGCCTQRCEYGSPNLDRIMVRFRPIAPKPVVHSGSVFSPGNNDYVVVAKRRSKRRYVKLNNTTNNNNNNSTNTNKKSSTKRREILEGKNRSGSDPSAREMVTLTLSLLPESPGNKGTPVRPSRSDLNDLTVTRASKNVLSDQTVVMQHGVRSVGSLVIVESMEGVWNHDPAKRTIDLENDTCPGFLSNGCNSVLWTNQAYKMMVGHDHEMVWLVMKERFPSMCWAFVCRVRLQYKAKNGKKSMIVPCDVWRMAGGDLAWRLDVQAALSLGR